MNHNLVSKLDAYRFHNYDFTHMKNYLANSLQNRRVQSEFSFLEESIAVESFPLFDLRLFYSICFQLVMCFFLISQSCHTHAIFRGDSSLG